MVYRIGMVGAGGIAHAHLPAWVELGADVVVHSADDAAPDLVGRYGGRVVDSLDELFEASDIVDICTPSFTHRSIVEQSAAAGLHVICEKPLALTVADARAAIDACRRGGVNVYPAHVVRWFPEYAAAKHAVDAGTIGVPAILRLERIGSRPGKGWFADESLSGGIAMDQMIHDLDYALWVAGPVSRVFARRTADSGPTGAVSVHATLEHASGTRSLVTGAWGSASTTFHTAFQLAGDDGLLEHDSQLHVDLALNGPPAGGGGDFIPSAPGGSPFTAELRDLADACLGGPAPRVTAQDGVRAIAIAAAVNESIRRGAVIDVSEEDR